MDKQEALDKLKQKALKNENLPLKKGSTNLVFGVGNPDSEILFIGEGPGYWEDIKAEPFVGNAGALLNQLLMFINLERKDVYITNVIMYRAPNNRDPTEDEIAAFRPYLDKIIKIIDPKVICTLGRFSMAKFLPGVYISKVHGKEKRINWEGKTFTVVPMYHPAAALRNGDIKFQLKRDFERLPQILEVAKESKEKENEISDLKSKKNDKIKIEQERLI